MGKYTLYGTPQFDESLDSDLRDVVDAVRALPEASSLQAIILMGGYGRGEGTPFQQEGVERPFNDYDLVVVSSPLPSHDHHQFQQGLQCLEKQLSQKLGITVDLYLHTTSTLENAEASLMNYEMRHGHKVLYGAQDILTLMPAYDLSKLPLDEGTRLLLNRGKLLLDVKVGLGSEVALSPEKVLTYKKFLMKCHLAFGDCILLANGEYDLSYVIKKERLQRYLKSQDIPDADWVVDRYVRAVDFKNSGDIAVLACDDLYHVFSETLRYYLGFFLWYESKRLHTALPSLQTYVAQLPLQPSCLNRRLKAFLLNLRLFTTGLFSPKISWALVHPRNRLYPALWLLLSFESSMQLDLHLIQQLLNVRGDYSRLLQRFYELRGRLS